MYPISNSEYCTKLKVRKNPLRMFFYCITNKETLLHIYIPYAVE